MKTILIIFAVITMIVIAVFNAVTIMGFWQGHHTKGGKVFYRAPHSWKWFSFHNIEMPEADVNTMKSISWCFGKDKNHCYYKNDIIPGCDPETIKSLDNNNSYCRDKNFIFLGTENLSDDPDNFQMFPRSWAKDSKQVYRDKDVFPMDAATFKILDKEAYYVVDKDKVYCEGKELIGADPATFEILENGYSKDKYRKYRYSQPIPGAKSALAN